MSSEEVSGRGEVTGGAPVEGGLPRHFVARNIRFELLIVAGHDRTARERIPVFGAMPVALKAQSLARIDDHPLDLVVRLIREHLVVAPGTVVFFQRHDASPIRVLFYSLPLPASRFLKGP